MSLDAELEIISGSSVVGQNRYGLGAIDSFPHCEGVVTDDKGQLLYITRWDGSRIVGQQDLHEMFVKFSPLDLLTLDI